MLHGIDISQYQGAVDIGKIKTNQDFILIRATMGTPGADFTALDADFFSNRDNARRMGIPRAFYHYAYPEYNSPEDEADWFAANTTDLQIGEILALDFEENFNGDKVDYCLRFLNRVSGHFNGYKPLLYIDLSLCKTLTWNPVINANYGLWLALWDYNPDSSSAVAGVAWPAIAFRQFSNHENLDGLNPVDSDVFYGGENELKLYGYQGGPTPSIPSNIPTVQDAQVQSLKDALQNEKNLRQSDVAALQEQILKLTDKINGEDTIIRNYVKEIAGEQVTDENYITQIEILKKQTLNLTNNIKVLENEGQIVSPLKKGESLERRLFDFVKSLLPEVQKKK